MQPRALCAFAVEPSPASIFMPVEGLQQTSTHNIRTKQQAVLKGYSTARGLSCIPGMSHALQCLDNAISAMLVHPTNMTHKGLA
jgi:hypothetical protein